MTEPVTEQDEFMTVTEVAEAMRVSKMSVYRLAQEGDLDAVRFGRVIRIPRQSFRSYLDRNRLAPRPETV